MEKVSLPYVPHLINNPLMKHLMINKEKYLWKAKKYYITFDCETFNNKDLEVELLSISYTFRLPDRVETKYFDKRNPNFMKDFLNELFVVGKDVIKANIIPNIELDVQDLTVSVVGYKSKRFDINVIINYIAKYGFEFTVLLEIQVVRK